MGPGVGLDVGTRVGLELGRNVGGSEGASEGTGVGGDDGKKHTSAEVDPSTEQAPAGQLLQLALPPVAKVQRGQIVVSLSPTRGQ